MFKPIGIFDSGYGGLTVFKEIQKQLPELDYIYLGDNARMPYGNHSFQTIYEYTKECVFKLFDLHCDLVILACNTASARALRSIQQNDLPEGKKVLGVIRPTTESIKEYTQTNEIGILGTQGTVSSLSYQIEINKFYPEIKVFQQACPLWASLAEHNDMYGDAVNLIIKKDIEKIISTSANIDVLVLACTHYPLLLPVIKKFVPEGIDILSQGEIVAKKLVDYLKRHSEISDKITKNRNVSFYTTDDESDFNDKALIFYGNEIQAKHIEVSKS